MIPNQIGKNVLTVDRWLEGIIEKQMKWKSEDRCKIRMSSKTRARKQIREADGNESTAKIL